LSEVLLIFLKGSVEATTCLIVLLVSKNAVIMSHLDSQSRMVDDLEYMMSLKKKKKVMKLSVTINNDISTSQVKSSEVSI